MSKILVVGINYAPEKIGTGKYTSELCEWLVSRGHSVRVVSAPPYYPEWKIPREYSQLWYRAEKRNGVELIRCPIWVPTNPSGVTRLVHLVSFAISSFGALVFSAKWRPDWVINIAPSLASAPGALVLAWMAGAKSWLHIQDFEVDAAFDLGLVKTGIVQRIIAGTENKILTNFDVVSSISSEMVSRLETKGVEEHSRFLFPNWVDTEAVRPLEGVSPYRTELGIPDSAVVALYSGSMGKKQGLDLLGVTAASLANETNLYFVFGGEGPARKSLEQACQGLPNVRVLGLQPVERLGEWLGLADIHLLPQRSDVADLVMPSKLLTMFASGRPVLATADAETGLARQVKGRGITTPPNNVDAFISALRELTTSTSLRRTLGDAGRAHSVAAYSRQVVLSGFESRLC